ncbi:hypothetical protein GPECTOR_32g435 [Gonium pectorale]|uniref:Flavin-containing monooxygenase n=1 Tax=Gonium pectorale TaxID=33097 RepID=A0A150GDG8_GONPE|nr:hypothetical protein GPECTOR_32g435 [Gonium pectorale]|eukprot:KXZ47823.1 hypothetical protein GPECTOR_32g435 [Gonium pectorale]
MWGDPSATYESLQTNLSRYTCSFSDFPWPPTSPDFPSAVDVSNYLASYRDAFLAGDNCAMALGCEVLQVLRSPQGPGWVVEWRYAGPSSGGGEPATPQSREFDFVIVASGYAAAPFSPQIPGLETFPGLVIHSKDYRGPSSLTGRRRVAVVGGGHSAVDIAADLAAGVSQGTAAPPSAQAGDTAVHAAAAAASTSVVHVLPRPFWVIPRYLPSDPQSPHPAFLPLDLQLYRRSRRQGSGERLFPTAEHHRQANTYFHSVCGDQGARLSPCLAIPPDCSEPAIVAVSDTYGVLAASGRMQLRRASLQRIHGASLELSDGGPPLDGVDAIVLCTGFRPRMDFLPADVLATLSYTPDDRYVPLALHRGVLHPDVPGLAFVGMFRGPYFGTAELQARLAAAALSGALPAEADAAQREGVAVELRLRAQSPRPVLPHGDYVGHADSLAAALGVLPPPEWRAEHDVVVPAHFALVPPPRPAPPPHAQREQEQQSGEVPPGADQGADGAWEAEAARRAVANVESALRAYRGGRMVAGAVFRALHGEWALHRRIDSRMASSPSGTVTGRASFVMTDAPGGGADTAQYLYQESGQFTIDGGGSMRVRREYVYSYDKAVDRIDVHFAEGGSRGGFFHSLRFLPPASAGEQPGGLQCEAAAAPPGADTDTSAGAGVGPCRTGGPAGCGTGVCGAGSTGCSPAIGALETAVVEQGEGGAGASISGDGWRAVGDHLCIRDMYRASYRFAFQGIQLREFEIQFRVSGPQKDYTATALYTRRK